MQRGEPTLFETKREGGRGREMGESAFTKQQGVEKRAIGEKERKKERQKREYTEAVQQKGRM